MRSFLRTFKGIYESRNFIISLSKNDFKSKYTGSLLGMFWAFMQPIMTILVFWAVFAKGFRNAPVENIPFLLWFTTGLVPWFFYSEAWTSATNCFLEYSYLVKKVVFKISILPIIKIMSSLFVHLFFVLLMVLIAIQYKYYLSIYSLQLIYYLICLIVFIVALSYITASLVVFSKDVGQIIGIILQFGMWLTPVMWSYKIMPENWRWVFKINPMYYIIEGYRDSILFKVWFWEKWNETLWFWDLTIIYLLIGYVLFKKLKTHFADVL